MRRAPKKRKGREISEVHGSGSPELRPYGSSPLALTSHSRTVLSVPPVSVLPHLDKSTSHPMTSARAALSLWCQSTEPASHSSSEDVL